jgi:hypothetical protein
MSDNTVLPDEVKMKLAALDDCIKNAHPTLPILLREIHTLLKSDPAIVTILSDTEISTVVEGLKRQTKTEIAAAATKKKTSLKNVGLADL